MGIYVLYFDTALGPMGVVQQDQAIRDVFLTSRTMVLDAEERPTRLLARAGRQIEQYLDGQRMSFSLPLFLKGSPFQIMVWQAVLSIPYGQTRSYKQIACQVGKPRAARAVGTANRDCPLSVLIPCHRVIRHDGTVAGGDYDSRSRQCLLTLEQQVMAERKAKRNKAAPGLPALDV